MDDEVPVLNLLRMVLEKTNMVTVEGAYTDPQEALENIKIIKPEALFLDIEMPEMNGLELAERLVEHDPDLMVVFVTGYNQYALEAFNVNALDYLLKPVTPQAIQKCIARLNKLKGINDAARPEESKKRIYCFGDFQVIGENGPVTWVTRKVEELLAYLIVNRNTNLDGWELGGALWPEAEPDRVKANLHTTLFRLRKTIKEEGLPIEILSAKGRNGTYHCTLNHLSCDLLEFEEAVVGSDIISNSNIEKWERISSLYKEDLFLKKDYRWCEAKRAWLRQRYLNMLLHMAGFYEENGHYQKAVQTLLKAAEKEPFDEEIHRSLLYACHHQKNAALMTKLHQEFIQRLAREMSITPQLETTDLYRRLMGIG
ncbi:response regulator [Heliophilum fasciatum]|uniref:response regulator n=1 Tax=Heliophilum fasciatum TaxID=35700 RepID=UPI0014054E5F|nr:response regulator [Heliophilum fasciatum]MCW2276812.1 two-component SAPR family response regulator [Heliophilum fasciatum]